ncbi:unnamed protein product [Porites evermanni]|uniref:Transferrin-like domain-containing protein n=1 Tax=Porites evermanni TaxID=104178 RepID=A0ABN8QAB4_9CNID|nr:unnamed protein product [Porites evermanni]
MAKCRQFIQYVNETAQNKSLPLKVLNCVEGSTYDDCATKIKENKADLVTLDGGRVYAAGKNDGLVPIVSEKYGKYGVKYYGVAIVKKSNTGFNLEGLKGKKSCHTGARRTAGWNVPIGYLLRKKIIPPVKCDTEFHDFYSASKFFLESCVPGVKSYDVPAEVSDKLCAICNGTGSDKCSRDVSKNG